MSGLITPCRLRADEALALRSAASGDGHSAGPLGPARQADAETDQQLEKYAARRLSRNAGIAIGLGRSRAGRRSQLRIGTNKDLEGRFQAHAWMGCAGEPLLSSEDDVASYPHVLAMEDKLA